MHVRLAVGGVDSGKWVSRPSVGTIQPTEGLGGRGSAPVPCLGPSWDIPSRLPHLALTPAGSGCYTTAPLCLRVPTAGHVLWAVALENPVPADGVSLLKEMVNKKATTIMNSSTSVHEVSNTYKTTDRTVERKQEQISLEMCRRSLCRVFFKS